MKLGNITKYTCFRRLSNVVTFFAVCITVLYIDRMYTDDRKDCQKVFQVEETLKKEIQVSSVQDEFAQAKLNLKELPKQQLHPFSVKEMTDALPIPYEYLLGTPPTKKRYLSIGISSVKRKMQDYLMGTIHSIFGLSSAAEREEMLLVIYLANTDPAVNKQAVNEIAGLYRSHVDAGSLIVICSSMEAYPPLSGLKRNFQDSEDRVRYRSKQNVDFAFLVNFCAPLSEYYLMLEDDVVCAENFLTAIKNSLVNRDSSWTTITYSKLGYIGKLYHAEDLPKLARFLLMFYDEMPGDWLLEHFHQSKAQPEIIRIKPSLFQHIGTFSSFESIEKKSKDDEFSELAINSESLPPASCFTNLEVHEQYDPVNVCQGGSLYFWGKSVEAGKSFTILFKASVDIKKITIATGASEYPGDILYSGYVQFGRMRDEVLNSCKMFNNVGPFQNGRFELSPVDGSLGARVDCIRIQVTAPQKEWLIIKYVRI